MSNIIYLHVLLQSINNELLKVCLRIFLHFYIEFVRPHLEYVIKLWTHYLVEDIDIVEKEQIRATKLVKGFSKLPYSTKL